MSATVSNQGILVDDAWAGGGPFLTLVVQDVHRFLSLQGIRRKPRYGPVSLALSGRPLFQWNGY